MQIQPTDALLVVDVQRDFCPGGALAVEDGDAVVPVVNRLAPLFTHRIYTRDWHPPNHCSFSEQPQYVDGSWPVHCVAGTEGAMFHPGLQVPPDAILIDKATDPNREAYSDFEETLLADTLHAFGIGCVMVCGLATNYCVRANVLDAIKHGFRAVLIEDACRGIDIPEGAVARAIEDMQRAGAAVTAAANLA